MILAGLEHLDERYVKAVGYATKARRHGRPKMVLMGDIVGDDDDGGGEGRFGSDPDRQCPRRRGLRRRVAPRRARNSGWIAQRTAAIARHTNAFKINEDVVIPLDAPRRLHRGHRDGSTSSCSLANKIKLCDALDAFVARAAALAGVGSGRRTSAAGGRNRREGG